MHDTSIVKFWYRDISKYRQYRRALDHRTNCLGPGNGLQELRTLLLCFLLSDTHFPIAVNMEPIHIFVSMHKVTMLDFYSYIQYDTNLHIETDKLPV